MPKKNRRILPILRWLVISILIGAGVGYAIGVTNNRMASSLLLGIGIGFILGLVLAVQGQSDT